MVHLDEVCLGTSKRSPGMGQEHPLALLIETELVGPLFDVLWETVVPPLLARNFTSNQALSLPS